MPPGLLGDPPTGGDRREERPAVVCREPRGTVITAVELEQIPLVEDVVEPEEGAAELIGGPAGSG